MRLKFLAIFGPGLLVAATGVGAGDLATSAFTGRALGLAVLWAVVLGAFFKFVLNEGLARWQLATGRTLIEGCADRFGRALLWLFLGYLLIWSFLVAGALMSAVGATCHAIWPVFGTDASAANKVAYGVVHSALAVALVIVGGFRLFERVMAGLVAIMFLIVLITAVALFPSWSEVFKGIFLPQIPGGNYEGISWTVALIGGVGGTVTVLCYGYWIREEDRTGPESLTRCRIDLATAYAVTAVFGIAMVIIGSSLEGAQGKGVNLIVDIAWQLETSLGPAGPALKWAFLVSAWAAVFSSLLGVWQSVPYLFADLWLLLQNGGEPRQVGTDGEASGQTSPHLETPSQETADRVNVNSWAYRAYLCGIASVPILGLVAADFQTMQKTYAVVGALFIPMLATVLLVFNGRASWVGPKFRNSLSTSVVLVAIILFFVVAGTLAIQSKLFPREPAGSLRGSAGTRLHASPTSPGGTCLAAPGTSLSCQWPEPAWKPPDLGLDSPHRQRL